MLALAVLAGGFRAPAQEGGESPPPLPPPRAIPGVTAPDPHPRACVDCHVVYPEIHQDERLSTLMKQWSEGVDPKLLATVQGIAPEGMTLKGRHPSVPGALSNPPATCLPCHGSGSRTAPPFAPMMHAIHLSGGEENVFLTLFQGECTHCHKLDPASGTWRVPSGREN